MSKVKKFPPPDGVVVEKLGDELQEAYAMIRGGREVLVPLEKLTSREVEQIIEALDFLAREKLREADALRALAAKKQSGVQRRAKR